MTDSNYDKPLSEREGFIVADDHAFKNNLASGFIAVTMIHCYYESFLNTVLRDYFGFSADGSLIRGGENEKLEVIFNGNEDMLEKIKASSIWRDAHRVFKLRNHLIHYKSNMALEFSSYPPIHSWKIGNEILGEFFVKSELEKCSVAVQQLAKEIASALGLALGKEGDPIICDYPYVRASIGKCASLGGTGRELS
jgi:hypothetical protein